MYVNNKPWNLLRVLVSLIVIVDRLTDFMRKLKALYRNDKGTSWVPRGDCDSIELGQHCYILVRSTVGRNPSTRNACRPFILYESIHTVHYTGVISDHSRIEHYLTRAFGIGRNEKR